MELGVLRKYFRDIYTIGYFSIDGVTICDTLEDKVRELHDINHDGDFDEKGEGKIYGETAIPCGRYKVEIIWWKKHQKYCPHIIDVPGFTGILIHSGVNEKDTTGCILVGENKIKGKLKNGLYWSAVITQRIQEAIKDNEEIFITIKQNRV